MASRQRKDGAREASRLRRLEKAKRRKTQKKQREVRRNATAKQQLQELTSSIAASGAFGMPALFRSLRLDGIPDISDGFTLAGLDLQLLWYETQEARSRGEDAEPLSSLQVDSCERVELSEYPEAQVWAALPNLELYRCEARLAECVKESGVYGRWLRMQRHQGTYDRQEEYAEISFAFLLVLGRGTKRIIRVVQPRLAVIQPTELVPGAMNLFDASIVDGDVDSFSELQVDRWFEMINMLRIVIPRIGRSITAADEHNLRRRLQSVEAQEAALALELGCAAESSVQAWIRWKELRDRLTAKRELVASLIAEGEERLNQARTRLTTLNQEQNELEQSFREAQANALASAKSRDMDGSADWRRVAERAFDKLERLRADKPEVEKSARSRERRHRSTTADFRAQIRELETRLAAAEVDFRTACAAEAPISKRFEFAHLRREELLAELACITH